MALNHAFIALLPVTLLLLFLTPRPTSSSTVVDVGYGPEDLLSEEQILRLYDTWLAKQGRSYGSLLEKAQRLEVFKENLLYIDSHNRGGQHSYSLGLNRFADMTNEEYRSLYLAGLRMDTPRYLRSPLKNTKSFMYAGVKDVPDSVDWRLKGAVTDVKNQGSCGSCWAFSSIASVEGINQIVTKELVSLSEQELIDCDTAHNEGCNGGMMDNAFDFIISNGGIDTEQDYPYQAKDNQCNANKKNSHIVTIDNFEDVPENDENSLLKAVANQPVSVAIEASSKDFQLYAGGVFDGNCTHDLDHGVAIVGYGTDASGKAYWIVKNSWGQSWGENGYIRMARGLDGSEGLCGINMEPSYPIKKGPNPPAPTPTPPTPPPTPNMCDNQFSCPDSTTCCCIFPWRSMCFAWGCCPMESATCCKDHYHCCPQDYPTCDLGANTCLKKKNDKFGVEMLTRTLATYHGSFPFGWKNNDESRDQGLDIVMMVD